MEKQSPYLKEDEFQEGLDKLEKFLIDDLDVRTYSEMVLLFETLKSIWQRDEVHQDITEGVHLEYSERGESE